MCESVKPAKRRGPLPPRRSLSLSLFWGCLHCKSSWLLRGKTTSTHPPTSRGLKGPVTVIFQHSGRKGQKNLTLLSDRRCWGVARSFYPTVEANLNTSQANGGMKTFGRRKKPSEVQGVGPDTALPARVTGSPVIFIVEEPFFRRGLH